MKGAASPAPHGRGARFLVTLAASFLALLLLASAAPTLFFTICRPLVVPLAMGLDSDYEEIVLRSDGRSVIMEATCAKLGRFHSAGGQAGPSFRFDSYHLLQAVEVYPLLILALLTAWPLAWRGKALAMALGFLLAVVAAAFDLAVVLLWSGSQHCSEVWAMTGNSFPATPENLAAFAALQREISRLTILKSFLSTGGRQFLSLVAFLLALAPAYLLPSVAEGKASRTLSLSSAS